MAWGDKSDSNSEFLLRNEESNEITESLKLFVAMTLKSPDYSDFRIPIEIIKRDFENNGIHVDDLNNAQRKESDIKRSLCTNFKGAKRTPKKKLANISSQFCVFCENNKEPFAVVRSHAVRDALGNVLCPKLRSYECPLCHAIGDNAHTVKYCPKRPIITMEDTILAQRLGKLYPFPHIISILNV